MQQECSREGGISLQRVTSQDVGIRAPPDDGGCLDQQMEEAAVLSSSPSEDCPMTDDDGTATAGVAVKGPITLKIEIEKASGYATVHLSTVDDCKVPACSSQGVQAASSKGGRPPAPVQAAVDYVPGQPLLAYTAVRQAQEAWQASHEYRVPTLMKYSSEHDTGITWQRRMSAVRCDTPLPVAPAFQCLPHTCRLYMY